MRCCYDENEEKGFTIAELLVVVAIIGILVAVSIPIFAGQRRKAVVATNKANIRAARAAAMAQYYDDLSANKFVGTNPHLYYKYDIASGKLTAFESSETYDTKESKKFYDKAKNFEVCPYIMIYEAPTTNVSEAEIQTAPYYTDDSGDFPASTTNNNANYYGPSPQNKTR